MAKQQGKKEREIKTGLCPNCHKFGDKCSCGYNYGFITENELRKWQLEKAQTKKYKGIIISVPFIEIKKGDSVFDTVEKKVARVVDVFDSKDPVPYLITFDGVNSRRSHSQLKNLQVQYSFKDIYGELIYSNIPLKFSQWENAIKFNQIDTNAEVEYQIRIKAYDSDHNEIPYAVERGDYTQQYAKIVSGNLEGKLFTQKRMKEIAKRAYEAGRKFEAVGATNLFDLSNGFDEWWENNK